MSKCYECGEDLYFGTCACRTLFDGAEATDEIIRRLARERSSVAYCSDDEPAYERCEYVTTDLNAAGYVLRTHKNAEMKYHHNTG